jgi:hypothetical protein
MVNWASLRGVNYGWSALHASCAGNSPDPAVSFPQFKANNWNMIRVPIGWDLAEASPTNFISYLSTMATEADAQGLFLYYDFHAIKDCGWPSALVSQYSTIAEFYTAWWGNKVTYRSQNAWQLHFNEFWKPLIQTVDSHSSTMGYEIMNEPPGTGTEEQPYNQFVYDQIRSIGSTKTVIYCNPFDCPGCGPTFGTGPSQSAKPSGTNIALDCHDYDSMGTTLAAHIAEWTAVTGLVGVVMGEFGSRGTTETEAQTYLTDHYTQIKNGGIASTYWWWASGSSPPYLHLLNSSDQQWWIDTAIVNTIAQVYRSGGPIPTKLTLNVRFS